MPLQNSSRFRALSIRQPWAWAIIYAGKDIENRSEGAVRVMRSGIGERIFIHTSRSYNRDDFEWSVEFIRKQGKTPPTRQALDFGGIIGSVKIVDIVSKSRSTWFFGDHGLVLTDPRPCLFFPAKGVLNLFYVTPPDGVVP